LTSPQELLFGQPINPITSFENIFSGIGKPNFAPNGINGAPNGTTDSVSSINYIMNKRGVIERSAQQRPMVRLADKDLNIIGELTGELSQEFEEIMSDSGSAKYVLHVSNWLVDYIVNLTHVEEDLHLIFDPFPNNRTWRNRWGGKMHTINVQRKSDGTSIVEMQAVSNREHMKKLLFAANPFLMPEVQLPRMWLLPGPTRSVLFMSGFVNLARLFVPGLSFITNIFDPVSWLNPFNASSLFDVNPLNWPIQVAFVDPVLDQSRWTVLGATWTNWHDASQDILKDSGCMARAYTWLTEDVDSPHIELVSLTSIALDLVGSILQELIGINPSLATSLMNDVASVIRPGRNCVIISFEDKSGQTGPTGTAFDGLLNVLGVTLDDLVSSTLMNTNTGLTLDGEPLVDLQGNSVPIFESLLGVAPAPPKVIWREGQFMGQIEANHLMHKGSPRTVMTGSKSPKLVNDLQTFGIKWALSQLSDLINPLFLSPANTAYQTPLTPGLDELYQGQLDNVLFAWERITSPIKLLWGGDVDFQEYFERGSGTAYTLSSIVTLQTALWKSRSYHGFKGQVLNGYPWVVDVDTGLGEGNGWEFNGVIYVEQINAIHRKVDRKSALQTTLTVGDDKDKADPLARTIRALQGVYALFGAFLGEGTLFS
jgi:hypothetical protein